MTGGERVRWITSVAAAAVIFSAIPLSGADAPGISPATRGGSTGDSATRTVTSLGVVHKSAGAIVTIGGDGDLDFEHFLIEGKSLVIDIYYAVNTAWPTVRKIDGDFLRQIKIGEHFKPRKMVRILLELQKAGDYTVRSEGSRIIVAIGQPGSRPETVPKKAPDPNLVTDLSFQPLQDRSRIAVETKTEARYRVVDSGDPLRLVVEIDDARLSPTVPTALDLSGLERELERVDLREESREGDSLVRITALLRRAVPFRVTAGDGGVLVDVDHVTGRAAPSAIPSAAAPKSAPAAAPEPSPSPSRSGRRVSLDFVDADVNDILRLVSDVSGINFVSGDEVRGSVSVRLIDVPWEVALETILMTNNPPLAQVLVADNIVRITTEDKLLNEEEKRQKKVELERRTHEAEQNLEPLVMKEFSISYAQLGEKGKLRDGKGSLMDIVRGFTSPRVDEDGIFKADPRTNTLIIKDLPDNMREIEEVIRKLDTPTPAVIVEARIVEVADGVSESLGVRWNAQFSADPAHGNALPLAFPNSINVGGNLHDPQQPESEFMVNLPASTPTAALGISFGHIASTLSLDLQLSAMEDMGMTKILSNPKILVVQNEKASINIGDKLPVPRTDAEGNRTVEFEKTGILLEVTPQVTNDGRVFMDILIEKSSRGETVPTTDGPMFSINNRDAVTKVLIADGETAVIGGILTQEEVDIRSGVPYFSKIPGLGWLFRSKTTDEQRTELMIFLTPRIIPNN